MSHRPMDVVLVLLGAMTRDDLMTVAFIVILMVVFPVSLLWSRDKGYLKTAWGVWFILVSLGIGANLFIQCGPWGGFDWEKSATAGATIAAVMLFLGVRWVTHDGPGIEHVPKDFKCDEVTASVEKARMALPEFVKEVEKNIDGAYIKYPLHTPNGNIEHIWAYVHTVKDGAFNVTLVNTPFDRAAKAEGRRDVPLRDVVDWQILYPDGRVRGAFSILALFQHFDSTGKMSRRMRKQRDKFLEARMG